MSFLTVLCAGDKFSAQALWQTGIGPEPQDVLHDSKMCSGAAQQRLTIGTMAIPALVH